MHSTITYASIFNPLEGAGHYKTQKYLLEAFDCCVLIQIRDISSCCDSGLI